VGHGIVNVGGSAQAGQELSKEEIDALQHFMLGASIPLVADTDVGADPFGTGILFEVEGRRFLVTANHHFEDIQVEHLAVPLGRYAAPMKTLGNLILARPDKMSGPDVAVLELQDPEMAAEIAKHWRFLSAEHIGAVTRGATHVVLGYPSALGRRDEAAVHQHPLAIYSTLIDPPPPQELKDPLTEHDLFFQLERQGVLLDGAVQETPKLQGASGAPIFEIGPAPEGVWAPEKVLRFVGVQRSALQGKWFRATGAAVVEAFFDSLRTHVA